MYKLLIIKILAFFLFSLSLNAQEFRGVYPKLNQYINEEVSFSWTIVDSASSYTVQVSNDILFNSLYAEFEVTANEVNLDIPDTTATYYWRVIANITAQPFDTTVVNAFNSFYPKEIDSLNLWLRADTGVVITNNKVSMWNDLSDSALVLNQVFTSIQPSIVDSVLNGYPGVLFDFASSRFDFDVGVGGSNYTIALVYNTFSKDRVRSIVQGTGWSMGPRKEIHSINIGFPLQGKAVELERFVVHTAWKEDDSLHNYVNDSLYAKAFTSSNPGLNIRLGHRLDGYLTEVIVIDGHMSDTLRREMDNYLMDKYAPPINLGPDRRVCTFPDSISINVDYAVDYEWNTGDTTNKLVVNSSGKYYLTVTDMFERKSIDSIFIILDTLSYTVNFPYSDTTICPGDSVEFIAGIDLYDYNWNLGDTTPEIVVTNSGIYKVTIENCRGGISSDSVEVKISNPEFDLGIDTTVCFNNLISISPDSNFTNVSFQWSSGEFTETILADTATIYSLTVTDNNFQCSYTDSIAITIDSTLFGGTLGNDTSLCAGNNIGLKNPIIGVDSYQWSTGLSDSIMEVNLSGTYTVTITESNCEIIDSVAIIIKGVAPIVGFTTLNNCFGDSIHFTDTSFDQTGINFNDWRWDFGDGNQSILQNPVHYFDSVGAYTVELIVTNDSFCAGVKNESFVVDPKPQSAFNTSLRCVDDTIQYLNESSISTGMIVDYDWDFGDLLVTEDTSIVRDPKYKFSLAMDYSSMLIVTSDKGCIDTTINQLTINPAPITSFTVLDTNFGDTTRFNNTSSIISGNIDSYQWDFGNGKTSTQKDSSIEYKRSGKYAVMLEAISDSSCNTSIVDTVIIPDAPPEFMTIYPKLNQYINGLVNFQWNNRDSSNRYVLEVSLDSQFNSLIFSEEFFVNQGALSLVDESKVYYWRVVAYETSRAFDTTNIGEFQTFFPAAIDSVNLWLRADTGIVLTNNQISSWDDLSDSSLVLDQVVASFQPKREDSVINNYPGVLFDFDSDRFEFDIGLDKSSYTISAVYNTFSTNRSRSVFQASGWSMGPRLGIHTVNNGFPLKGKSVDINRFVVHTAWSKNDSLHNYVNDSLYDKILASSSPGKSIRLGQRLDGYLAELIIVDGYISDTMRKSIDAYLMDKYAPPINLGPDRKVCTLPDSMSITIDYALHYEWSTGDTTNNLTVNSPGKYYLTVTDIFNRKSIDSIYFILDTLSYQVNFPLSDTTICLGDSVELIAGTDPYEYSWNTADTSSRIVVNTADVYIVSVQDCKGRISTDSVEVKVSNPLFDLGIDTTICFNGIIQLSPDSVFNNVSYQWSSGEQTDVIFADTTSVYRLTVTDNVFLCSYVDSIDLQIDSTLFGLTLGNDTILCQGNSIGLKNPVNEITSYIWTTGNDLPVQEIDTAGFYKVEVGNGRCIIRDTIGITIKGLAPTADFFVENFCFQDTMQFSDLSSPPSGDTLVSWKWNFSDGLNSNSRNTNRIFSEAKIYEASLEIETNRECIDTISKIITVNPKPLAEFTITNSCAKEAIQFNERAGVTSGFIQAYFWNFGDPQSRDNLSTIASPIHTYDTLGTYFIELIVETDKGCLDTVVKEKLINPKPAPSFAIENICLGDSTHFIDQTILPKGEVLSYRWIFDNNNTESRKKNPKFKYSTAGEKPIAYRVISDSMCQSIYYDTIVISENPIANFNTSDYCVGIPFEITNTSISSDSIIEYRYIFANQDTSFLKTPIFSSDSAAVFDLSLNTTSTKGCSDSITIPIVVNANPQADFNILNNGTGIPFNIRLENNSIDASQFLWSFGNGDESILELPAYTYIDTGKYELQLKVTSNVGCVDSIVKQVEALSSFLDATLERIDLIETSTGAIQVLARIINSGHNTIEEIRLTADLNNEFQFSELINEEIFSGDLYGYQFNSVFIQEKGKKVDFICVRIETVNGIQDSISSNNELCKEGFKNELFLKAYPNPTKDYLTLDYVLPNEGEVIINIYDAMGRQVIPELNSISIQGFYSSKINVERIKAGIYHYSFVFNGIERQGTFIKE